MATPYNLIGGGGNYGIQGTGSSNVLTKGKKNTINSASNSNVQGGAAAGFPIITSPNSYGWDAGSIGAPQVMAASTTAPATTLSTGGDASARAAAAAEAARASSLRGGISGGINQLRSLYDQIYGSAEQAAAEQGANATKSYDTAVKGLTNDFNTGNEAIGASYSSAGTFDSSYRANDQNTLRDSFDTQVSKAGNDLRDTKASIGSWLSGQRATRDANIAGFDQIAGRLGEITDVSELTSLRNEIDRKIIDARAGQGDVQTMSQNIAGLNRVAGNSYGANLQGTLQSIIGSNAAPAAKRQVAVSFISNSGATDEEKQALLNQVDAAIATTQTV